MGDQWVTFILIVCAKVVDIGYNKNTLKALTGFESTAGTQQVRILPQGSFADILAVNRRLSFSNYSLSISQVTRCPQFIGLFLSGNPTSTL